MPMATIVNFLGNDKFISKLFSYCFYRKIKITSISNYIFEQASKFSEYSDFVLCKYKKTGTYHIFPAKESNKSLNICQRIDNIACCGKSFDAEQLSSGHECLSKDDVRTRCAKMAKDEDICGICIATFYKIEEVEN